MKKNGFAILELLLVVAILAVLASLVLPNILNNTTGEKARENKESATSVLFFTEAREILRSASDEYLLNAFSDNKKNIFAKVDGVNCENALSNVKENINYYVEFNKEGNVSKFFASDGSWLYSYISDTFGSDLTYDQIMDEDFVKYSENINNFKITCNSLERTN